MHTPADARVAVWDIPIRVVHWALAALLAFSWYSAESGQMDWHRWSGYGVLGLVVFRALWGFFGSSTARFASFVRGPAAVWTYAASLGRRVPGEGLGHNPIGALAVIALLLIVTGQIVTGLFAVDVDGLESGPLSDRVTFDQGRWFAELHEVSFVVLQAVVVLHIVAVLFYLFYKRDNLIAPMITGSRRTTGPAMTRAPVGLLLVAIAVSVAMMWFVSNGLRL